MAFDPVAWAEDHPWETGGIIVGAGLIMLWMFGFFGKSGSSSGDAGAANMAAAYYAAEAQQAVVGGQIAIAQDNNISAVKVAGIQADAAVGINAANANASVTMNANQYASATTLGLAGFGADVTKAGYGADVAKTQAAYGYQTAATHDMYGYQTAAAGFDSANYIAGVNADVAKTGFVYNYNTAVVQGADALAMNDSNNNRMIAVNQQNVGAHEFDTASQTLIPAELGLTGGTMTVNLPAGGTLTAYGPPVPQSPNWYQSLGYPAGTGTGNYPFNPGGGAN